MDLVDQRQSEFSSDSAEPKALKITSLNLQYQAAPAAIEMPNY
jgi:hypothetical protein